MSDRTYFAPACPAPADAAEAIQLAHGGGGGMTRQLIEEIFRPAFAASPGELVHDGAVLELGGARIAFTTDSYVVRPLFFPGGDIGSLAVNGTVNDLAMCGARPLYLSLGLVLEEGLPIGLLRRVVDSMRRAAEAAGVRMVTGDTKVVERGKGDGVYINTTGVGLVVAQRPVAPTEVRAGDVVLLSGDVGRHGVAIMSVREGLEFESAIESDCAPLAGLVLAMIEAGVDLHCLRDLTRGGLATALIEIAEAAKVDIRVTESAIAVSDPVRGACEILGLDPLYVANEGRFVAFVPPEQAERALAIMRRHPLGAGAAAIGTVEPGTGMGVVLRGLLGGSRVLDMLSGEQLPRIC
ncbi:MAG TPA: hydrogenase expression/formation protein HypE [Stellaceae bacterium]|nr:hydrogenase expression/formation protein HypE [Stellaceae bacterium]